MSRVYDEVIGTVLTPVALNREHLAWEGHVSWILPSDGPLLTDARCRYAFTIPHKAYAAGDTIPVSVKFSPLAKGVRIVSLITTIREHTYVSRTLSAYYY